MGFIPNIMGGKGFIALLGLVLIPAELRAESKLACVFREIGQAARFAHLEESFDSPAVASFLAQPDQNGIRHRELGQSTWYQALLSLDLEHYPPEAIRLWARALDLHFDNPNQDPLTLARALDASEFLPIVRRELLVIEKRRSSLPRETDRDQTAIEREIASMQSRVDSILARQTLNYAELMEFLRAHDALIDAGRRQRRDPQVFDRALTREGFPFLMGYPEPNDLSPSTLNYLWEASLFPIGHILDRRTYDQTENTNYSGHDVEHGLDNGANLRNLSARNFFRALLLKRQFHRDYLRNCATHSLSSIQREIDAAFFFEQDHESVRIWPALSNRHNEPLTYEDVLERLRTKYGAVGNQIELQSLTRVFRGFLRDMSMHHDLSDSISSPELRARFRDFAYTINEMDESRAWNRRGMPEYREFYELVINSMRSYFQTLGVELIVPPPRR